MRLLVTAGNTQALIDKVRCITNIFSGRTGAAIAVHAHQRGHQVTLLTSHPEVLPPVDAGRERWEVCRYRAFDELRALIRAQIQGGALDAVIHCAAVSDFL